MPIKVDAIFGDTYIFSIAIQSGFAGKESVMGKEWQEVTIRKLPAEEIERLLHSKYGDKIQPVDSVKLAKQRRDQAKYRDSL